MRLLDQVRKTIVQHNLIQRDGTVVLGVSGGSDSLALAHLLRALSAELHISLHLAHLNHQLRGADSDADAEFVAQIARAWNLPATIGARDVAAYARDRKLSIEEAAREARYAFLAEVAQKVGGHTIAVAHHVDDQVETVLMHLLRGAGMAGLRGMECKSQIPNPNTQLTNHQLQIIRPLLDVTRAEIESYCEEHALQPRFDLSNLDTTLFRNRLRQEVLPYLEELNPNVRAILLHTARSLADDYEFLQTQVAKAFRQVAREGKGAVTFDRAAWGALHPALQRGTLRAAIERLRSAQQLRDIAWTHIEDARLIAFAKNVGAQASLPDGLRLTVGYDEFYIADETRQPVGFDLPQLNVNCIALPRTGAVGLPGSEWTVEVEWLSTTPPASERERWCALFDARQISGETFLRRRKAGDRFQPAGMQGHTKSLHEFMIDEKIPHPAREGLPILCDAEKILWVCGYRLDERARVIDGTHEMLRVTLRKREAYN